MFLEGTVGTQLLSNGKLSKGFVAGAALVGAAAMLATHRTASAALIVDYNNFAQSVVDNGAGDTDPAVGKIINNTNIAGFGVTITVAFSDSPGSGTSANLQINTLDITNNNPGPATLTIRVSDSGFTTPPGPAMFMGSSVGGTFNLAAPTDTVSFQSLADPANGQPAGPVVTAPLNFVHGVTPDFNGADGVAWARGAGPFSLSNITTITLSPGGQANISGTTTVVPEPVIGVGALASVGLLGRRRRGLRSAR
jgi:hypothetical protein